MLGITMRRRSAMAAQGMSYPISVSRRARLGGDGRDRDSQTQVRRTSGLAPEGIDFEQAV
jgi:hypothetical protein